MANKALASRRKRCQTVFTCKKCSRIDMGSRARIEVVLVQTSYIGLHPIYDIDNSKCQGSRIDTLRCQGLRRKNTCRFITSQRIVTQRAVVAFYNTSQTRTKEFHRYWSRRAPPKESPRVCLSGRERRPVGRWYLTQADQGR